LQNSYQNLRSHIPRAAEIPEQGRRLLCVWSFSNPRVKQPWADSLHHTPKTMETHPQHAVTTEDAHPQGSVDNERALHLLIETGLMLASERSLDVITQCTLEAGLKLCGAQYGIFVYLDSAPDGATQQLCKFSGLDAAGVRATIPFIELTHFVSEQTSTDDIPLRTRGIVRVVDMQSPGDGHAVASPTVTPFGALPLRSYLVVPVRSRTGELFGALAYGHAQPGVFAMDCEEFVATIASQAGGAIENFRLGTTLTREIDIADRARALQRETADRLHQALEAGQLGTWTWDRDTDLLDLDEYAARILGVPPGAVITRKELREKIVVPEDQPATIDRLQLALDSGENYSAEYRIDLADGCRIWVSATAVPIFATRDRSKVIGMVGNFQDITARKMQEQALRDSEKLAATGRLAATIAHEINNPLEAITNLIYLARTDAQVPETVRQLLDTADAELARVSQIAQQTLGFYRDTTRPVSIDLNKQLLSTVDLFARKMQSKTVTCTLDLEPGLTVFGLQGEIRQVFSNLLVNAIDASSHSTLHIRARRRRQNAVEGISVLISDHGDGIPANVRGKLFTPFITTKQSVGTGLGLWVTRGIVEKQGGTVSLRTRTEAPSGTIFRVFLPLSPSVPK
jgi:PAS domain S-box-containing protein